MRSTEIEKIAEKLVAEQLLFAPNTGHIHFMQRRMVLLEVSALAEIRRVLIDKLGIQEAKTALTRLGYQQGVSYYHQLKTVTGDDPYLLVNSAMRLAQISGFVSNQPIETLQVDIERGIFAGDYHWHASWEAESYLKQNGISGQAVCWMMTGFASGFSTATFGKPVLWREIECTGMGHKSCRVVGKPLDEWEDADELGSFLQVAPFVSAPTTKTSRNPNRSHVNQSDHKNEDSDQLNQLVGASAGFNNVIHLLKKVSKTDASVLFLGESGVGKERFSKALHGISKRKASKCISVNCAAIPSELVEAELFGVEKGAFTGATSSRTGRFERANGGTLFLDEIGSLPLVAQGKLLRAIQEGEIERVGGSNVIKTDVRLIAATNTDLREQVKNGEFRADLFFRLNVYPIEIPPLRERREDIALLFNVFIERYCRKLNRQLRGITRRALDAMWHHDWPGNVRELENMVERAVILADENDTLDITHLFSGGEQILNTSKMVSEDGLLHSINQQDCSLKPAIDTLIKSNQSMDELESQIIRAAMQQCNGNISKAARLLKIGRGKLQYKLSKV